MASRNRTRIIVDGTVVELLKDGVTTVSDYPTEIDALNAAKALIDTELAEVDGCLLYTSPSPRDKRQSRMPSSA